MSGSDKLSKIQPGMRVQSELVVSFTLSPAHTPMRGVARDRGLHGAVHVQWDDGSRSWVHEAWLSPLDEPDGGEEEVTDGAGGAE